MARPTSNPLARPAAAALAAFIAATGAHIERPITVSGNTHDSGWREAQHQDELSADAMRSVWREPDLDPETLVALREALAQLPPDLAEPLRLVFVEGLTHREVGERLGVGRRAIDKRIDRALALLREALGVDEAASEIGPGW